jgi:hypothetical protein
MPYLGLQTMLDEENAWGQYNYDNGCALEEITDDVIDVLTEHFPHKQSPGSVMLFYRLDSAYSDVGDDETAFSGVRSPGYMLFTIAVCPSPEVLEADRAWVRGLQAALAPHVVTRTYVNGLDEDSRDIRTAYGPEKYDRLRRIKAKYDPNNVFRRNANIKPGLPEQRTGS